jgi:hypothetical protein
MTADTKELIRELAQHAEPVRRPSAPILRALLWLAISAAYIGLWVALMPERHDAAAQSRGYLFAIEQAAALATGLTAAIAAFVSVAPGYSRNWALLPALPFVAWMASLGPGCVQEWNQLGITHLSLSHDPWCVPFIVLFGAVPAVVITIMLRRGAPLTPRLTSALAGLAAAGLANAGVRIVHPEDVSVILLFWHVGAVMALSAFAGVAGRYFFNWTALIQRSKIRS